VRRGHTNLGKQRSSVDQFGHSEDSAYSKSKKMEEYHEEYKDKQKQ
jgi:hypothetical protein